MEEAKDTEQVVEPTTPDRAEEVAVGPGREDNRNDEVDGSPIPDPTGEDTGADDIPEAD